jgi:hypothetical protein
MRSLSPNLCRLQNVKHRQKNFFGGSNLAFEFFICPLQLFFDSVHKSSLTKVCDFATIQKVAQASIRIHGLCNKSMDTQKRVLFVASGVIFFTLGFFCATVIFRQSIDSTNLTHTFLASGCRQSLEELISGFREESKQHTTVKALEDLKLVANIGILYLAANDDFSAYALFKRLETPVVYDSKEFTGELVVAEFPLVLSCPKRLADVDTVCRFFHYLDSDKRITIQRSKNDKENFYVGLYSIITPRGTVNLTDTEGYGLWDILEDGIYGRIYDSVGLCWVERYPDSQNMSSPESGGSSDVIDPKTGVVHDE